MKTHYLQDADRVTSDGHNLINMWLSMYKYSQFDIDRRYRGSQCSPRQNWVRYEVLLNNLRRFVSLKYGLTHTMLLFTLESFDWHKLLLNLWPKYVAEEINSNNGEYVDLYAASLPSKIKLNQLYYLIFQTTKCVIFTTTKKNNT